MDLTNVAIVGGGPAGCTLGTLLSRQGSKVTIFDVGERPELLIGESMIPAIMPILRELDIVEKVAAIGALKPGASMFFEDGLEWHLSFSMNGNSGDHFAYNVPRKAFDDIFIEMAESAGVTFKKVRAHLEVADDAIRITEMPEATFCVDASGRSRQFARKLGVNATAGPRKDVALFAHCTCADQKYDGNILMGISESGWSWRIPLRDRVSIGIVAPYDYISQFGGSDEHRYDEILKVSPCITPYLVDEVERLTPVMRYNNYQLTSDRMTGVNWAIVGDAAGFIDPVFSSGAFLAISGAMRLADALLNQTLPEYEPETKRQLRAWQKLVSTFYDGRYFKMVRYGEVLRVRGKFPASIGGIVCEMISGLAMHSEKSQQPFYSLIDACCSAPASAQAATP